MKRLPMTPDEFDRACRKLERRCPWLSATSGYRSPARNEFVGGADGSKHVLGMARDYVAPVLAELHEGAMEARKLGLWTLVHDAGSGDHLHVQGLAPGEVPGWWLEKYE